MLISQHPDSLTILGMAIKQPAVVQPIIPHSQFDRIVIDLVNLKAYAQWNDRNKYILDVVDSFSCYGWSFPLKSKKAVGVAMSLITLFNEFSPPRCLQSDNGGEFVADVVKLLCKVLHVEIINGKPFKPNVQGKVERFNQTIEREMGKYLTSRENKRWIDILPRIVKSYNTTYHTTIKMTPHEVFFNWKARSHVYVSDLNEVGKLFVSATASMICLPCRMLEHLAQEQDNNTTVDQEESISERAEEEEHNEGESFSNPNTLLPALQAYPNHNRVLLNQ